MLDIRFIKDNKELLKKVCKQKNVNLDIDELTDLYDLVVAEDRKIQELSAEKNSIAKQFTSIKSDEDKTKLSERSKTIATELKSLNEIVDVKKTKLKELMLFVPNVVSDKTPIGVDDSENVEVKRVGEPTKFDFTPLDHITILLKNNWADFDSASTICGSRSYALKNEMVFLERAIQQLAMDKIANKGFEIYSFPSMAKEFALYGTGHFPASKEDVYKFEDGEYLTGTAEVQLNSIYAGKILNENDLPITMCGFSSCFRREAGSHGKDVKGLVRVHQFTKVEQYIICKADLEEGEKMHQFLLHNAEEILQDLELPYRVIECCTGDMGVGKYRMYDVEAWVPTQNKYRETHSCSNLTDWQARRTNIRYR